MTTEQPPRKEIPGPPPKPLVGWSGNIVTFFRDPLAYMMDLQKGYGNVVAFAKGTQQNLIHRNVPKMGGIYFSFGPQTNQVLLANSQLFQARPRLIEGEPEFSRMSAGLMSFNGEAHRYRRRLILPAFHRQYLTHYHNDIVKITDRTLSYWQQGYPRNILQDMQGLALDIANECFFGGITESGQDLGRMGADWMKMAMSLGSMIPINLSGTPYRRLMDHSRQLDRAYRDLIQKKRDEGKHDKDILATLVHAVDENGDPLTDDELIGHANILTVAGHETTANALTWTLFLLSQHPEIMANLAEEMREKLGGNPPSFEQIGQLPYLERVIKESLRILPPVADNSRLTTEETELGGFYLPKWSEVHFSPYVTHHLPELYNNPEVFDPDRWLTLKPEPYAYIPFGGGARLCIGREFALMELQIVLPMILQKFRLEVIPYSKVDRHVMATMAPKTWLPMIVYLQDKQFIRSKTPVLGQIHEMVKLGDS